MISRLAGGEIGRALVERRRVKRFERRREPAQRVVGEMGIGDVALLAEKREPPGQRAAPAVLDHVAERGDARRLAEHAMVERSPLLFSAHSSSLTVPLTAGPSSSPVRRKLIDPAKSPRATKSQRRGDGSRRRRPSCRRRRGPKACRRGLRPRTGSWRQRPTSPVGTTSVWPAKTKFGASAYRNAPRGCRMSGMPGSEKVTSSVAKAGSFEQSAQIGQGAGVGGRHRRAADQRARDLERGGGSGGPLTAPVRSSEPRFTAAAFRAPAPPNRARRRRSAARCWRAASTCRRSGCA